MKPILAEMIQPWEKEILICTNEVDSFSNKFRIKLSDNCIVFENFTASIGELMVANLVYWRHVNGASKWIFKTIKSQLML